jgi:hypothetical protein
MIFFLKIRSNFVCYTNTYLYIFNIKQNKTKQLKKIQCLQENYCIQFIYINVNNFQLMTFLNTIEYYLILFLNTI